MYLYLRYGTLQSQARSALSYSGSVRFASLSQFKKQETTKKKPKKQNKTYTGLVNSLAQENTIQIHLQEVMGGE